MLAPIPVNVEGSLNIMGMLSRKLGVDLGTINVMIYAGGQLILQEPAMVALTIEEERVVAVGQ